MSAPKTAYQTHRHTDFKIWLLRRNISQRRIARDLGISVQYLNDIIKGDRKAPHIRVRLICEFGVPPKLIEYHPPARRAA